LQLDLIEEIAKFEFIHKKTSTMYCFLSIHANYVVIKLKSGHELMLYGATLRVLSLLSDVKATFLFNKISF